MKNKRKNQITHISSRIIKGTQVLDAKGLIQFIRQQGRFTQKQADWNQTDTTAADYIKNKPALDNFVDKTTSQNITGAKNFVSSQGVIVGNTTKYQKDKILVGNVELDFPNKDGTILLDKDQRLTGLSLTQRGISPYDHIVPSLNDTLSIGLINDKGEEETKNIFLPKVASFLGIIQYNGDAPEGEEKVNAYLNSTTFSILTPVPNIDSFYSIENWVKEATLSTQNQKLTITNLKKGSNQLRGQGLAQKEEIIVPAIPTPPASGNYQLACHNGKMEWLPFSYPEAFIIDNGAYHSVKSLTDSGICSSDSSAKIKTDDGIEYERDEFNCQVILTNAVSYLPNNFLYRCESFNQPLILPSNLTQIGEEFLTNCYEFNQPITLPNSLTSIGRAFMNNCVEFNSNITFSNNLTSIGADFLYGCSAFNKPLALPNSLVILDGSFLHGCSSFNSTITFSPNLKQIGNSFMINCSAFNKILTLPNGIERIGTSFMSGCKVFNQDLTLPDSLLSVGMSFLYNANNYTSKISIGNLAASVFDEANQTLATSSNTALIYTTGPEIDGTYEAEFVSRFPNRTSLFPYRKLRTA